MNTAPVTEEAEAAISQPSAEEALRQRNELRQETRRWWIGLFVQPALMMACVVVLIIGLGVAQRLGIISAGDGGGHSHTSAVGEAIRYICPMMCTKPQSVPGRCPVCAMELVPATSGGGNSDSRSVQIDPASRRVANIHTVAVKLMPMTRTIRAIGELNYDEGRLKTLSAYVDGRIDHLYADYTGVVVKKDDQLALVYSPKLYSSQVEMLLAKKSSEQSRSSTLLRVTESNRELYKSSRQRLIELGMTDAQIKQIEQAGEANSRIHLYAPISGTVIEKLVIEGQYVKEGQAIYKMADLSTLWLMLELFPEDAATIRYGQKVEAEVQSLPGRKFTGRVAFIDPHVDPRTRTVGVRVVIPNQAGELRVGDYAKATIAVPVSNSSDQQQSVYDPDLANKWISPRHPHVIEASAGHCRECGVNLVPAVELGFTSDPNASNESMVVPRDAVLRAGTNSVLYVETEPGRFEIRRVVLGPVCGDVIVVLKGVMPGEQVATRGNFLIDSQMQLSGNPSLIDPTRIEPMIDEPKSDEAMTPEMIAAISKLPEEDRLLATAQRICPVTEMLLGSMGTPLKVDLAGQTIFICCKGCEASLLEAPETHLANLIKKEDGLNDKERAAFSLLESADRTLALQQRICPVADFKLGSMGKPIKVDVNGTPVFICCEGCRESLLEEPVKYLAKLPRDNSPKELGGNPSMNFPPIGEIQIIEPQSGVPPIGDLQPIIAPVIEVPQTQALPALPEIELPVEILR
ncbi:MAG: hypothetical protein COA78_05500 [Blastopirellula sp.]|nr:MAG: hypothetical protein COA78_05500 [Blastopirellula sp.]